MNLRSGLSFSLFLIILLAACTGASTLTQNNNSSNAGYPDWYSPAMQADSSSFSAGATAIASDSLTAISRAEAAARAELENFLAFEIEQVRRELESNGEEVVSSPDFLMMLRNAHAEVENRAVIRERTSAAMANGYRAFAQAAIGKQTFRELIREGLSAKSSYWELFSSSESFRSSF